MTAVNIFIFSTCEDCIIDDFVGDWSREIFFLPHVGMIISNSIRTPSVPWHACSLSCEDDLVQQIDHSGFAEFFQRLFVSVVSSIRNDRFIGLLLACFFEAPEEVRQILQLVYPRIEHVMGNPSRDIKAFDCMPY